MLLSKFILYYFTKKARIIHAGPFCEIFLYLIKHKLQANKTFTSNITENRFLL
jgi:hypothetical protein